MDCYAGLACIKDAFGDNLHIFHNTWNTIVKNHVDIPNNVEFIPFQPGIILNGQDGKLTAENINDFLNGFINYQFTKKVSIIATPVYFFNYGTSGRDRHHFCCMYIFIDSAFGNKKIPKISINYFNPHGYASSRVQQEQEFLTFLRSSLLNTFTNNNNTRINIRTNLYNGINLQAQDPFGMCLFYGFMVLLYYLETRISNKNIEQELYNITINQLVDELLDNYIFEDNSQCEDLNLIAKIISDNLQRGGNPKNAKRHQLEYFINFEASKQHLENMAEKLNIKHKKYLKRNLLKLLKTNNSKIIDKIHAFVFN